MAEPYSDEELATVLRLLDENGAIQNAATIRRLMHERDDARRVAKVLAKLIAQLIADVRREALEEAAVSVERFDEQATNEQFMASRKHMARRIRALKDGAK